MAQALLPLSLLHKMPAPGLPLKEDRSPVSHLLPAFPPLCCGEKTGGAGGPAAQRQDAVLEVGAELSPVLPPSGLVTLAVSLPRAVFITIKMGQASSWGRALWSARPESCGQEPADRAQA